jgi:hypothetical protein
MNDTIYVALIGGVSGLITGAVGSLIAPWVQWGIEKRRKRMDNRRVLLYDVRKLLDGKPLRRNEYRESKEYGAIAAYLSKSLKDRVEQRNTHGGEELIRDDMHKELCELEKKWGLT